MLKTTLFFWDLLSQFHSFQVLHVLRINRIKTFLGMHFCRETDQLKDVDFAFKYIRQRPPDSEKNILSYFLTEKKNLIQGSHARKDG